ncbi:conserved hypothetical protein [Histoplasma capsulatum H143]|uniref:Aminoglycoside phosphotransferase domain-containing protein n=1 Tax=Ajellomyces capsulatus (strain H143) TaxID=544712 RepID=C6HJV1_AJECH|nr:conserved hypothetical protein [Histoplasma capsulatum H143]
MDLEEIKDDLEELYNHRSTFCVRDIPCFRNPHSNILWKFGPIFTERELEGSYQGEWLLEACVEGPNPGLQGVAKIRIRLPDDGRDPSTTEPKPSSTRVATEFKNHDRLTKLGAACTPKLLDYALVTQQEGDRLPGGFLSILIMERLPGRNLVNFVDLPMSQRDQVRLAFAKTIREFYALKFMHNDPDRRNLMWDPEKKKRYIIDLEDACQLGDKRAPRRFIPALDFRFWGVAGPGINCNSSGLDPMVPYGNNPLVDPDDATLEKMAADAAGKELVFGQ